MVTAFDDGLGGLEPRALWKYFKDISRCPRPSKNETRVLQYLIDFAEARSLEWQQDTAGNLVIRRPGTGGGENAPVVVVQGHVDMVCEKDDTVHHDFNSDPIKVKRTGDWVHADGTTLGADNGIGVAAALALLDMPATAKLPPLECLFTVDEETGLNGAYAIDKSLVKGRTMLNLDTEVWGEICVSCAGAGDSTVTLDVQLENAPSSAYCFKVVVEGLMGGHSGLNIHEDRANAVQLLAGTVEALLKRIPGSRLVQLEGGEKRNAIARQASAFILVPPSAQDTARSVVAAKFAEAKAEFGLKEHTMCIRMAPAELALGTVVAPTDALRMLALLRTLPHGPVKFSHAMPGLVETSNNLAMIRPSAPPAKGTRTMHYTIATMTRSALGSALEAVRDRIESSAKLCGAHVARSKAYPGWAPNMQSQLLQVVKGTMARAGGVEPKVVAVHAGLECGILGERFPGMDMVSFGPTIEAAHSPQERVYVPSVVPFWQTTLATLEILADRR